MSGSIGSTLRLTLFGRSHGPSVGMTLTGVPAGKTVSMDELQAFLKRRAQLPRGCGRTQLYDARRHEGEHTEGAVLDDDCEAEWQKILHIVKRKDDVGSG